LINHFRQCHAAFLETNYDDEMLMKGRYPASLKNRIRGGNGHLSNAQALDLFKTHRPAFMSHLLLAHLSKDNNNPQLVQDLFDAHREDTSIVVASRFAETAVYHIQSTGELLNDIKMPVEPRPVSAFPAQPPVQQLRLF
jgi:hypothetical protein